jgi:hypothetical protein
MLLQGTVERGRGSPLEQEDVCLGAQRPKEFLQEDCQGDWSRGKNQVLEVQGRRV